MNSSSDRRHRRRSRSRSSTHRRHSRPEPVRLIPRDEAAALAAALHAKGNMIRDYLVSAGSAPKAGNNKADVDTVTQPKTKLTASSQPPPTHQKQDQKKLITTTTSPSHPTTPPWRLLTAKSSMSKPEVENRPPVIKASMPNPVKQKPTPPPFPPPKPFPPAMPKASARFNIFGKDAVQENEADLSQFEEPDNPYICFVASSTPQTSQTALESHDAQRPQASSSDEEANVLPEDAYYDPADASLCHYCVSWHHVDDLDFHERIIAHDDDSTIVFLYLCPSCANQTTSQKLFVKDGRWVKLNVQ